MRREPGMFRMGQHGELPDALADGRDPRVYPENSRGEDFGCRTNPQRRRGSLPISTR
jgi:hypothetical protein